MPLNERSVLCGFTRRPLGLATAALAFALAALAISFHVAQAQSPGGMRIPPYSLELLEPGAGAAATLHTATPKLIVDTDTGIDDATALAWLLQRRASLGIQLLGITTVAGNTSVGNATSNVQKLLDVMNIADVSVYSGADKPLSRKLTLLGLPIHGLDGLGYQNSDGLAAAALDHSKTDAVKFICQSAENYSNVTMVAMGPMTNVARAVKKCPEAMRKISRIYLLGGAKYVGGNTTATAEFNFFVDPEAAGLVMAAGLKLVMVPFDAFGQFQLTLGQAQALAGLTERPGSALVGNALIYYLTVQLSSMFGENVPLDFPIPVPDPAIMMAALEPNWVTAQAPALVRVTDKPDVVRGQSVIGLWPQEQFMMIATDKEVDQVSVLYATGDIEAGNALYTSILEREPLNVESVVMSLLLPSDPPGMAATMVSCFLYDLGLTATYSCAPASGELARHGETSVTGTPSRLDDADVFLPALLGQ